ncbi:MAG: hypothetical protein AAB355_02100 [Patescibacteria group bacterium]
MRTINKNSLNEKLSRLLLYFFLLEKKEKVGVVLAAVLVAFVLAGVILYIVASIQRGGIVI